MTRDDDFIGQLEGYLEEYEGLTPLPDAVRRTVRTQLRSSTQSRRPAIVSKNVRIGLATAAVALVAIVGISLFARPSVGPSPSPSQTQRPATWTSTEDLLVARLNQTATLLVDGMVLVAGGSGTTGALLDSAELYDPVSGSWSATGNMISARAGHTATLLADGKILVVGGGGTPDTQLSAELYDPGSGTWTATGSLRGARAGHTATLLLDGRVLVAGGTADLGAGAFFSAEIYDPGTGTWTSRLQMIEARGGHTATLLPDGKVLVVGGNGGADGLTGMSSSELYDPVDGSWTESGHLNAGRANHTATLLVNGMVLVAGGHDGSGFHSAALASAELYDPATGSFSATGSMITADAYKTATLLADGKVLVAGGYMNDVGQPHESAELYDATTGTWSAAGIMITPRTDATAILLLDGRVLVVGGSHVGNPLRSAELYGPGG